MKKPASTNKQQKPTTSPKTTSGDIDEALIYSLLVQIQSDIQDLALDLADLRNDLQ